VCGPLTGAETIDRGMNLNETCVETCYLFSYFTGNGEDGLHLAWSADGYAFDALNNGLSYLVPEVGESQLMRDPCILRGPDGVFRMVWTTSWSGKTIGYASSTDLKSWSAQVAIPAWSGHPAEADVTCTWSPEVVYDGGASSYLIVWASTITGAFPETLGQAEGSTNHRLYRTTTTDFASFTRAELFFDPGYIVIDGTFLLDGGQAYLFFKDETLNPTAHKFIQVASSADLDGPYANTSSPITPAGRWSEGPSVVKIGSSYICYYDAYASGHYAASRSANLTDWEDITGLVSFPPGARHGTVIAVPGAIVGSLLPPVAVNLDSVVYRWSFNEPAGLAPPGTITQDASGTPAVVRGNGAAFTGTALHLPGTTTGDAAANAISAYLDLPNGIVSERTDLTVEVWATPVSTKIWQRLFDSGRTVQPGDGLGAPGEWTGTPGTAAPGTTQASDNLVLTLCRGGDLGLQRCEAVLDGTVAATIDSGLPTATGTRYHYALTYEDGVGAHGSAGGRMCWYRDGRFVGSADVDFRLVQIEDVNNWLGRPQWSADSNSEMDIDELRIHSAALSAGEVMGNCLVGPDVPAGP
jgi:uncharacterized protein (DUF779 family)